MKRLLGILTTLAVTLGMMSLASPAPAQAAAACAPTVSFADYPGTPFQEGTDTYKAVLTETQDMSDPNHNWDAPVAMHVDQYCAGFTESVWLGGGTCIPATNEVGEWTDTSKDFTVKMTEPYECMTVDFASPTTGTHWLTYYFSATPPQWLLNECPLHQAVNSGDFHGGGAGYIYSDAPVVNGVDTLIGGPGEQALYTADLICAYGHDQVINSGDGPADTPTVTYTDDSVWVSPNSTNITVNAGTGNDTVYNHTSGTLVDGDAGHDVVINFDSASVILSGGDGTDVVKDVGTDPILTAAATRSTHSTINGGPGPDTLVAKHRATQVYGGAGKDVCSVKVRTQAHGCETVKLI